MNLEETLKLNAISAGGPGSGRHKELLDQIHKAAEEHQAIGGVSKILDSMKQHTTTGGIAEHWHPGNVTVYRGGDDQGRSWSTSKNVAQGFANAHPGSKVYEKNLTADTPAFDYAKMGLHYNAEKEVYVPN